MADNVIEKTVLFDFTAQDLDLLIEGCAGDDLSGIVAELVPEGASVLEAGAGSGKWLKDLTEKGYSVTGIELDRGNVDRFRKRWPQIRYDHGDVEQLPYDDGCFDAILSLGVVEHLFKGPETALAEARRVLKPGGVLILTVPMANPSFWVERVKDAVFYRVYADNLLRRLLGKPGVGYSRREERLRLDAIRREKRPGSVIKYQFSRDRGRTFYEYRFSAAQIGALIAAAGFEIADSRALYQKDRLYQIFGRLVGSYSGCRPVELNRFGTMIRNLLPSTWAAHMILIVAYAGSKPAR